MVKDQSLLPGQMGVVNGIVCPSDQPKRLISPVPTMAAVRSAMNARF